MSYFKKRILSFQYAIQGVFTLFRTQPNAQIHLLALVVITALGLYLGLERWEWVAMMICMAIVLMAEAMNTALEFVVDMVTEEYHPLAEKAKDVAAAGVLIAVIICGIAWGIVFLPKIWELF